MDIRDIVMINIHNYVSNNELEFEEVYNKLCSDIALYIEENIINEELTIDLDKISQLLLHFLSVEMDFEKFVIIEQQIMDMNINDETLSQEDKLYNTKISHEIIKIYKTIDKEQIILDILNKVNFKQKIKSR